MTKKGQFVGPYVGFAGSYERFYGFRRCDANISNPLYHFVYAESPEHFDTIIEDLSSCRTQGNTHLHYPFGLSYMDHSIESYRFHDSQMTPYQLSRWLFHTVKYGVTANRMVSFEKNIEISGKNIHCYINDIKSELLFCLDVRGGKQYYIDSLASFHQLLQEKCHDTGKIETGDLASSLKEIGPFILPTVLIVLTHLDPPTMFCVFMSIYVIEKAGYYLNFLVSKSMSAEDQNHVKLNSTE